MRYICQNCAQDIDEEHQGHANWCPLNEKHMESMSLAAWLEAMDLAEEIVH